MITVQLGARSLLLAVPLLFGIATLTFFLTRVVPGDPSTVIAGPIVTPEIIATIREQYGFDDPLLTQYVHYLGDLIRLDLGTSLETHTAVLDELTSRIPATLVLIVASLSLALAIGIPSGLYAARRRGRSGDRAVRLVSFASLSTPDFWLGVILLYVFFLKLGWAPEPIGQVSLDQTDLQTVTGAALLDAVLTGNFSAAGSAASHLVLPAVTLAIVFAAPITRLTRSAAIEAQNEDHALFARACGLPRGVQRRRILRSTLPSIVTFAGISFSILLGGAVLVEQIFSWGGVAQYAADAIALNDYAVIQAFVLFSGIVSIAVFLVVDLLYVLIDPRVRL